MFVFNNTVIKSQRRELRKNFTDAERRIWSKLRRKQVLGLRFFRQYSVGPYILDFYCPARKLGVEIDGGQHAEYSATKYDEKRSEYLNKHGIRIIRFWNNDILKNTDGAMIELMKNLTPLILPLA